jgi:hypothetical protein
MYRKIGGNIMARVIVKFKDTDEYVNIEAEEFHEDGEYIKAYSDHNELVGMFVINNIKTIYRSEKGV